MARGRREFTAFQDAASLQSLPPSSLDFCGFLPLPALKLLEGGGSLCSLSSISRLQSYLEGAVWLSLCFSTLLFTSKGMLRQNVLDKSERSKKARVLEEGHFNCRKYGRRKY